VPDLQPAAGRVVRQVRAATGQRVIDVPPAMTTAGRVRRTAGFHSRAASADLSARDNTVVGAAMADAAMIFFMVGLSPGDADIGRFG